MTMAVAVTTRPAACAPRMRESAEVEVEVVVVVVSSRRPEHGNKRALVPHFTSLQWTGLDWTALFSCAVSELSKLTLWMVPSASASASMSMPTCRRRRTHLSDAVRYGESCLTCSVGVGRGGAEQRKIVQSKV
jgi:hypothetical protein